jgi:uncharacterized membrane protein YfcA
MTDPGPYSGWILLVLMPAAAFLYASVGHGGASSYLMLLTFFHFAPEQIRPAALVLNIVVSGMAFLSYRTACVFPYRLFWPLVAASVPAAFLGGTLLLPAGSYRQVLAVLLLFPAVRLLGWIPVRAEAIVKKRWTIAVVMGGAIGFVSGLVGIGGGILLSPLLLFLGWTTMRETAAVSALFIFVNSIAGLTGSGGVPLPLAPELYLLLPVTVAGGIAGAWLGARRFSVPALKYLLASVLFVASAKFLFT